MMKQYADIKAQVPGAILMFRLGDFYEMFEADALLASKELQITLTGRGQGETRSPMCGVPFHSVEPYISKLVSRGYKVAICEQTEDPALAKGIVKREVVRIITPGTVTETGMLSERSNNYLMAVSFAGESIGISFADVSTGEFKSLDLSGKNAVKELFDEIERISPAEVLLQKDVFEKEKELLSLLEMRNILATPYSLKDIYETSLAKEKLERHFHLGSLEGFGYSGLEQSLCAASAIIDYLTETQKTTLSHINTLKSYRIDSFMYLDTATRRNLELIQTIRDRSYTGSLLSILDKTRTPMGARLLKSWLLSPLSDEKTINLRLDAVSEMTTSNILRRDIESCLDDVRDIERLAGRTASASANPRDIIALKDSLLKMPKLRGVLGSCKAALIKSLADFSELTEVSAMIEQSIVDEPPLAMKEGGIIKPGYNAELDEIKMSSQGARQWISDLESKERQRTGIKGLKIGYTKVFGYYIEVSGSNLKYVPMDYIRKQTLVNCERFITPELKEKESLVLNAQERIVELEYTLFCELREKIAAYTKELQHMSQCVAQTDALISLAAVAISENYVKPEVTSSGDLIISDGRHPVAEKALGPYRFVPNDTNMGDSELFALITGPNMAGKSTYMRQVALIVLLAQMGSFVPAKTAKIPIVDRIFTRVGSFDDLYAGQSTFMVEMIETANILNNATRNSLIILDEIGRGTATFDGMSIARAVAEFIHTKIHAKTLFATHYHELTVIAETFKGIFNLNVAVKEEGDHITFMHKIVPGTADKSYGIHVGKLAGLPAEVIERAKEVYNSLEMVENQL